MRHSMEFRRRPNYSRWLLVLKDGWLECTLHIRGLRMPSLELLRSYNDSHTYFEPLPVSYLVPSKKELNGQAVTYLSSLENETTTLNKVLKFWNFRIRYKHIDLLQDMHAMIIPIFWKRKRRLTRKVFGPFSSIEKKPKTVSIFQDLKAPNPPPTPTYTPKRSKPKKEPATKYM